MRGSHFAPPVHLAVAQLLSVRPHHARMHITPRCQRAIDYGESSARRFGASYASSPHLLLGLLSLKAGVAVQVLTDGGITFEEMEGHLAKLVPPANPAMRNSVSAAIVRAVLEAQKAHSHYVGTEHLLLALLADEDKEASGVFASFAFEKASARETLLHSLV
jgi:ATP-dependent Clp protease ATP-binding subunit ClpA